MVLLRLFQPAHGFLGIFDEVEKTGGVAGVVAGELVGAQGERCRLKTVAGAVLAGQGGGQVTLGHAHGGVGAAVPAGGADAEHAADIFGRCLVQ